MREKIFHLKFPVREAAAADDGTLQYLFSHEGDPRPAAEIRAELVIRQARGHRWIVVGHCSNFDPASGCRGHAREEFLADLI